MARPGLTGHRKFRRLVRALGSAITARGVLELLWDSCYECGDDYVGTAADVEHTVGWTGDAGALTQALLDAGKPEGFGFIEPAAQRVTDVTCVTDVTYRVHDLWHHAPEYVANRRSRENERRIEKSCARCGVTYHASDARSKFCSSACRQGGWRDRNARADSNVTRDCNETDRNGSPAPAPAPAPAPIEERSRAQRSGVFEPGSLPREHLNHIACSENHSWCVPVAVHRKLANLLAPKHGGERDAAGQALLAWYPTIWSSLKPDFVMDDAFGFYQRAFDAKFSDKARSNTPKASDARQVVPSVSQTRQYLDNLAASAPAGARAS